jgi:hypothetical protein
LPIAGQAHEVRPVEDAQALLEEVAKAPVAEHEALGLGTDLRFAGPRLNGGALVHEDRLLHLCAFRNDSSGGGGNGDRDHWRSSRMARASRRSFDPRARR